MKLVQVAAMPWLSCSPELPKVTGRPKLATMRVKICVMYFTIKEKVPISRRAPQSTEVFYLDHGETANGPIEKVYVTTLVTPMGLASSFNGGIFKIIVKKWANFENSINHHKNGLVWCM